MNAAEVLAKYHIPCEMLEAAGVKHATDSEAREILGVHGRALATILAMVGCLGIVCGLTCRSRGKNI